MLFYILILLFICFSALLFKSTLYLKHNDRLYVFLWCSIFFILYICKDNSVGADYLGYLKYFEKIKQDDWSFLFSSEQSYSRFEKGYLLLTQLMSLISQSDLFFSFVMACIMSVFPLITINRYVKPVWMGIFIFFALGLYINSFNILRQSIAMYICWLSIPYILNRSFLKFFILVIVAFYFHKTALIFIPLYFIFNIRFTFLYCLVAIGITCVIYFLLFPILSYLTTSLMLIDYLDSKASGGYMLLLFMSCCLIMCLFTLKNHSDPSIHLFLHILFLSVLIQLMAVRLNILTRVVDYYKIALIVLLPRAISSSFFRKTRVVIVISFIILFIYFFYIANNSNVTGSIPYNLR